MNEDRVAFWLSIYAIAVSTLNLLWLAFRWRDDDSMSDKPLPDSHTLGGFNHADLWEAYVAGVRDGQAHPHGTATLVNRAADAYCKLATLRKMEGMK